MEGYNIHRHKSNPKEKELHDEFVKNYITNPSSYNAVDRIVFGHGERSNHKDYLSDREKQIVISTIQWLGSPVGQGFLRDCGFKLEKLK